MFNKSFKAILSLVLAVVLTFSTCANAFAASSKQTYIKDVVISYGKTADEAKAWLTKNGYEILDYDLNEDADDWRSTERAVYLGYTTTNDPEEAITDMRLMNMKGGYSVQDYQMLLSEQKENIKLFINNFIVAVNEYRANYAAGQERAKAAHDLLNLLYDDDTDMLIGDLLLGKIKEEYTDEEFAALSADEQAKTADMTTILMQANADAVLTIENVIAMAADTNDSTWTERYKSAGSYDDMLDAVMAEKNITVNEAEKQLAAQYDTTAKAIASKFTDYKTFLEGYTEAEISFSTSAEDVEAYQTAHEDFDYTSWFAAGTQYELLSRLTNDGVSLYDLITGDDYDVQNADRYMLYPLVSVLTEGQRACIDFLSMYQLVAIGINSDEAAKKAAESYELLTGDSDKVSVYDGVDRTIFGGDVAMTNEALRLQAASGKNAVDSEWDHVSTTSFILYGVFGFSMVCTTAMWIYKCNSTLLDVAQELYWEGEGNYDVAKMAGEKMAKAVTDAEKTTLQSKIDTNMAKGNDLMRQASSKVTLSRLMTAASVIMTCVTVALLAYSLWHTWQDMNEYYNAEFTPIPMHMVNEATNDNDEKVYTYYDAVKCNRVDAGMVTDATKLLGDYGDINGDVGRQWVALYTTKDKAAGDPIMTGGLQVQYESSSIPKESSTALSMFGENVAQNLTNKQLGYTYADGKSGIYLFYNVDESAFAGSVFSDSSYILVSVAAAIVVGAAAFFAGESVQKKKIREA